jgi:hypothetical protein
MMRHFHPDNTSDDDEHDMMTKTRVPSASPQFIKEHQKQHVREEKDYESEEDEDDVLQSAVSQSDPTSRLAGSTLWDRPGSHDGPEKEQYKEQEDD